MNQIRLAAIVFLSGACVMMLELCGSRVLAPVIGSSIFVWTSLIGAILAALSAGYWWGGVIADRSPSYANLSIILIVASALTAMIPVLSPPILLALLALNLDVRLAALLSAVILFGPPSVALGMVSPHALRLSIHSLESSGRSVGLLSACSTLGSIAGTFLLGFFLLAKIGTTHTLMSIAALLAGCSLLAHFTAKLPVKLILIGALFAVHQMLGVYAHALLEKGVTDLDTAYQRVMVVDMTDEKTGKRLRILSTGPEGSQSIMDRDKPDELAVEYLKFFDLALRLFPEAKRGIIIGGGGYSFPKHVIAHYPQLKLDIVELDPGITEVARKYFSFRDSANTKIFDEDARMTLNRVSNAGPEEKYDIAFADAYTSAANIPFHLTSQEFLQSLSASVTEDGMVVVNVITTAEGPKTCLLRQFYHSLKRIFPKVNAYRANPTLDTTAMQNVVIIAKRGKLAEREIPNDTVVQTLLQQELKTELAPPPFFFTDDFAPSEHAMNFGC